MARRSRPSDPQQLLGELMGLLETFGSRLGKEDLRSKVKSLIPVYHTLRDLGASLIPRKLASTARKRILSYLLAYPFQSISGEELMVVGGIGEWARRLRELRKEQGWGIINGITAKEMAAEGEFPLDSVNITEMGPDDYILLNTQQDRDAAHRWFVANDIRRRTASVRDKLLAYFRENIGHLITGEELRYVANDRTEWARRIRELRTEFGWPIVTQNTGRPDLAVGVYVLEQDRQSPPHDRKIPDNVRGEVLRRDKYTCHRCHWSHELWNPSDPRHLELHHIISHVDHGENTQDNLITLCTVCHDHWHSLGRHSNQSSFQVWIQSG